MIYPKYFTKLFCIPEIFGPLPILIVIILSRDAIGEIQSWDQFCLICFRKMNMKNYTTTKQENVDKEHCIINISWLQVCITNTTLTVSGVWKQPIIIDWPMNFIQEWWALGELNNKGVVATSLGSLFYFTLFLSSFFAFYISGNFKR